MPREATRKGEQEPTLFHVCEYSKTLGKKAGKLYASTGKKLFPWQQLLLNDIMAVDRKGRWIHTKFGFSIPRQNGKNEVVCPREMAGLVNGEQILHTAHRTGTAHAAWERLKDRLEAANIPIASSYRALGCEHIYLESGGRIEFRTRTSTGALGLTFDLLVIDEAQEYQDDQESALKYINAASKNKQTIMIGTPPTAVSSGTVFMKYRAAVLSGDTIGSGWAEWSVDKQVDPKDVEYWYATNPSLGYTITERNIADEITGDAVDFNIQRLGLWLKYNQKSTISETEWEALRLPKLPKFVGTMAVGIKFNVDGLSVSLAIGLKTADGGVFVEVVDRRDTREGCGWIIEWIKRAAPGTKKVIVDGQNGQQMIAESLKALRLPPPYFPTVKEVIAANANFEPAIEAKTLHHMGQPALANVITNCEHRAIGSNGGFGYKSILEGADVSLMDAVILAAWGASYFPDKPTQTIKF